MVDVLDLGHLVTGVVELDPLSGSFVVRVENEDGSFSTFDVQSALARYRGQEVRLTLATTEMIACMAAILTSGDTQS